MNSHISITPLMTSFNYKGEEYKVIYVGKSSKSLRLRDYKQHFKGTAGVSTLRKSIGCLLGLQLIPRDINSPQNGKTTFSEYDEEVLTGWMLSNLLLLYCDNNDYLAVEKELIRIYNPPLNIQSNSNEINVDFRKELSKLRLLSVQNISPNVDTEKKVKNPNSIYCYNCGINLVIPDELKNEENIRCLSCDTVLKNPFYIQQTKQPEKRRSWKFVLIIVGIVFISNLINYLDENSNNSNGPTNSEAKAGVRMFLKYDYLKDPDSYESISWGAFGVYDKERNKFFALHKYRAKNGFGGYVVEEKLFVLDKNGNVIKVVDDINDIINGD